jgi:hypothetical protein
VCSRPAPVRSRASGRNTEDLLPWGMPSRWAAVRDFRKKRWRARGTETVRRSCEIWDSEALVSHGQPPSAGREWETNETRVSELGFKFLYQGWYSWAVLDLLMG